MNSLKMYQLSKKVKVGQLWRHKKTDKAVTVVELNGDPENCTNVSAKLREYDTRWLPHYRNILTDTLVREYRCLELIYSELFDGRKDKPSGRKEVTEKEIEYGIAYITQALKDRYKQKGKGAFASRHECLGVVKEEFDELSEAVRDKAITKFRYELADVAVAAIAGMISIDSHKVDW